MKLICPKCSGDDYFMSTRNVIKGRGGIYGNRGGTKQFPVCRVCNEIMVTPYMAMKPKDRQRARIEQFKSDNVWKQAVYITLAFFIILIPFIIYLS